mgnify:CR=1 FL=1
MSIDVTTDRTYQDQDAQEQAGRLVDLNTQSNIETPSKIKKLNEQIEELDMRSTDLKIRVYRLTKYLK